MATQFDIVIIGGGAAGIGAARRLATSGVSALLLEGSGRLGGRARTQIMAGHALDLGCGWLHSADRNPWVHIGETSGFTIDRRIPAWGRQYNDLGLTRADREAAGKAVAEWTSRVANVAKASDRASEALPGDDRWDAYIRAIAGFMSGAAPENISATDYTAYDAASTGTNWRVTEGYGTLVAASLPAGVAHRIGTPVRRIDLEAAGRSVAIETDAGSISARAVILTVSTSVLAGDSILLPAAIDDWRDAARRLPLGGDEKVFLEITETGPFASETQVIGNVQDSATGAYYIRPFGHNVIECFFGGAHARELIAEGPDAAYTQALNELCGLFGKEVGPILRPIAASRWSQTPFIGGAYSCALPGHARSRELLAQPYDNRLFFAGEATHCFDFSTAHGAYETGIRAADEALVALHGPTAMAPLS